jgi:lantibiotic biosynthesis protein
MTRWAPILTPSSDLARRAMDAAMAVAESVANDAPSQQRDAWRRHCQESLFYAYLARVHDDPRWIERATTRLNDAINGVAEGLPPRSFALYGGLCGLGWVAEHVATILSDACGPADCTTVDGDAEEDTHAEDANGEVDATILQCLQEDPWEGQYDLIGGLVGFGVYFLERLPAASAEQGLLAVLDQLERRAEQATLGLKWKTAPELLPDWQRELCPAGYYNLGVAHGIPGIIYLLSEIAASGPHAKRAYRLLDGAVAWLMDQRRPPGSSAWFSSWTGDGGSNDSRLAWCYGDIGILAVLFQAADRARRADWHAFSKELLDHCLARPFEQSGVMDAGLCHGAAGVAHIFNRIYQSVGDDRCRDAAITWLDRALNMRKPGETYGGFLMHDPKATPPWTSTPAFLDGSIGVALALLAATTPVEPAWDRLLLLSGREWSD